MPRYDLKRSHASLVREILIACNRLPSVFLFPVEVTVARRGRITRRLGMVGTPDILGWKGCECDQLTHANFIAFEVKVGKDALTREQFAFLLKLEAAGGIGREIRSVEDAVKALQ